MATDLERLNEGAQLAREGRFDEALSVLERILMDSPDDPDVLFMAGACHYKKGDAAQAKANWQRVLQIDPEHGKAQGMLAKLEEAQASGPGKPLTEAQKAVAAKASKKKPAPKTNPWLKWAVPAVLVVAVVALADVWMNPQSYGLRRGAEVNQEDGASDTPAQTYEDPAKRRIPLETGLPGRWYFKWEGDPTTLTFQDNGNMSVIRDMEGGHKLSMQGTYKVDGDTLIFNLKYNHPQQGDLEDEARMYNAKIEGVNLTFNFQSPDGGETLAVKQ